MTYKNHRYVVFCLSILRSIDLDKLKNLRTCQNKYVVVSFKSFYLQEEQYMNILLPLFVHGYFSQQDFLGSMYSVFMRQSLSIANRGKKIKNDSQSLAGITLEIVLLCHCYFIKIDNIYKSETLVVLCGS